MELYHQGHWLCSRLCAFSPWPSGTISSLHLPLLARPQVSRGPAISFLPFLILKLNTTSGPLPIGWEHALLQHTTTPAQNTDTGLHYLRWCQKVFKKKKQLDVSKIYEEKVWEETCMPWSLCSWTSLSQAISYCFDYCPENASVMLFVQPAEQQYLSGDGIHWENAFLCAKGNKQKHVTRLTGMETSCRR